MSSIGMWWAVLRERVLGSHLGGACYIRSQEEPQRDYAVARTTDEVVCFRDGATLAEHQLLIEAGFHPDVRHAAKQRGVILDGWWSSFPRPWYYGGPRAVARVTQETREQIRLYQASLCLIPVAAPRQPTDEPLR